MRICTWNINSVRLRLPLLTRLVAEQQPDVICLQETKVVDELFPRAAIAELGYPHQAFVGMKSYNGVAVLSRVPLTDMAVMRWAGQNDCRQVSVTVGEQFRLHNVYVPAGGDVPDGALNPKFAHKLRFVEEQTHWWQTQPSNLPQLLVGDLNIAPLEHDVWSSRQLHDVVSHTPVERTALVAWQQAYGFVDALRHYVPQPQKLYTWWSYRAADWQKSNRGRRLDHMWASPSLAPRLQALEIVAAARGWEQPSDHVPVLLQLAA